jgi:F-type H+-transporting ATPase subunit alpha
LNRGARLTELLKQGQFSPMQMEEQVCVLYAGVNGYLDALPVNRVRAFQDGLLNSLKTNNAALLQAIRTSKDLSDESAKTLKDAVDAFAKSFS